MTPATPGDETQTTQRDSFRARPRVRVLLVASLLLLIYGVPLIQISLEVYGSVAPRFLSVFTSIPSEANLRSYERELENSSIVAKAVRPWVQFAWFKLFRYAGEKVVVGREGWLFYRSDVEYLVRPINTEESVAAILDFRDQLARRGIRLMVIPMPGKPAIYPGKVTQRVKGILHSPTEKLISRLRLAGVETPDLFEMFSILCRNQEGSEPCYLLRDTHWSGITARLTAERVAQRIRDLGWIRQGDTHFDLVSRTVSRQGDLSRMISIPHIASHFPDEETMCYQVVRSNSGELYKDDPASPVLILGDSFLRMYQTDLPRAAGFIAHLARGLRMPVASIVNDGGASTLVRQELSRRAALLENKKIVIWQFVERDISYGAEGWKKVALPVIGSAASE
jgi:hypothetical protein